MSPLCHVLFPHTFVWCKLRSYHDACKLKKKGIITGACAGNGDKTVHNRICFGNEGNKERKIPLSKLEKMYEEGENYTELDK